MNRDGLVGRPRVGERLLPVVTAALDKPSEPPPKRTVWPVPHVPNPAYFPYSSPFQSVLFEVPFGFPVVISGWGDWSRFRQRRYCRWGAPGKCFYVDS